MGQVKNVTRYTVSLDVTQESDNTSLLSRLKAFSEVNQGQSFLFRYQWAGKLGIDRATIRRWEQEIINSKPKFAYLYYDGSKRKNKRNLDSYQRFFLALIASLKRGLVTGREMTNEEVIDYLEAKEGNRPRWMGLTRQEFQKWGEQYSQQQAS